MSAGVRTQSLFATVRDRELHYMQWTPTDADTEEKRAALPVVVCWHGLLRTSRDFDEVAHALVLNGGYRVVAPDTLGRGLSQWAADPTAEYQVMNYVMHAAALLEGPFKSPSGMVDWIGTSMGGLIGWTGIGAGLLKGKVRKIIMNDVGPKLSDEGIARIMAYTGEVPEFDTFSEFKAASMKLYGAFGPMSDEFATRAIQAACRRTDNGKFRAHYDYGIVEAMKKAYGPDAPKPPMDPWDFWKLLDAEVLVVHGQDSDLLEAETVERMIETHPKCTAAHVPGVGHAPTFSVPDQITIVEKFLCSS